MEFHAGFRVDDFSDTYDLEMSEMYPDPRVRRKVEEKARKEKVSRLESDREKFLELEERRREMFSRKHPVAPDGMYICLSLLYFPPTFF